MSVSFCAFFSHLCHDELSHFLDHISRGCLELEVKSEPLQLLIEPLLFGMALDKNVDYLCKDLTLLHLILLVVKEVLECSNSRNLYRLVVGWWRLSTTTYCVAITY